MGRRSNAAIAAAEQASEAARVLQARGQQGKAEVQTESEPEAKKESPDFLKSIPRGNQDQIRIREQIRENRGEPKDEAPKEPEKPAEKPAEADAPKVEEAAPDAPKALETAPEAPPAPKMVKAKVDGEEFEVSETEVEEYGGLKAFQMTKAAERRFKEAKEQTKQMQELMAQMVKQQTPAQPTQTEDQFIQSKVDTIRFGTPEESAAALKEVLSRQRIDPNQIIEQATEKMRHDQAVAEFDKDFPDIATNQILLKTALVLRNEGVQLARQKGERVNWVEFYRGIGNQIRGALPRQHQPVTSAPAEGTTSPQADKEARKASISEPPKAAAARAEAPAEPKEETREESLRRMKKARGLPTE
jgi:hypothetical protein